MTRGPHGPTAGAAHHASHTRLLSTATVRSTRPAGVNAVIVPTARPYGISATPPNSSRCSTASSSSCAANGPTPGVPWSSPADVGVRVVTVDVEHDQPRLAPTCAPPRAQRAGLAALLPQDRHQPEAQRRARPRPHGRLALRALPRRRHPRRGTRRLGTPPRSPRRTRPSASINHGSPDNSVVCHAYRRTGGIQGTFVGGGPWSSGRTGPPRSPPTSTTRTGSSCSTATASTPSPWSARSPRRNTTPSATPCGPAVEEFGDTLAEGVYALLDDGKTIDAADAGYWEADLRSGGTSSSRSCDRRAPRARRRRGRTPSMACRPRRRARPRASPSPRTVRRIPRAWPRDRRLWQSWLGKLPHKPSAEAAPAAPRPETTRRLSRSAWDSRVKSRVPWYARCTHGTGTARLRLRRRWASDGQGRRRRPSSRREDRSATGEKVRRCLDVVRADAGRVARSTPTGRMTGLEIELNLVDDDARPGDAQRRGARRDRRPGVPDRARPVQHRDQRAAAAARRRRASPSYEDAGAGQPQRAPSEHAGERRRATW